MNAPLFCRSNHSSSYSNTMLLQGGNLCICLYVVATINSEKVENYTAATNDVK